MSFLILQKCISCYVASMTIQYPWETRKQSDKKIHETKKKRDFIIWQHDRLVGLNIQVRSFTLMFLIWRLPSSCRDIRGSLPSRLTPSFSQLMEGIGSPDAWHFNSATLSTPNVWLEGPWRMMGGGLSVSTAIERQHYGHIIIYKIHSISLSFRWMVLYT